MKSSNSIWAVTALSAILFFAACGRADVGQECDTSGSTDECVDGAICTTTSGVGTFCREVCVEVADCSDTSMSCNGVSGSSTKSCQPH